MDTRQRAGQFWQNGYLMLEDFFDECLMDTYNALILKQFGAAPEFLHNAEFLEKSATEVIPWFPQRDGVAEFDIAGNDPRLTALTGAILGDDWVSHYHMVMYSRQGTAGQAWHQDCPPEDPRRFNLNRLVYTMDVTPDNGGQTLLVPGSHKRGLLPACDTGDDISGALTLQPRKGTLILIHGHCWHRVTPVTGKYRVSTNYRCGPAGTGEDLTDICVYRNMRYRFSTNTVIEDRLSQARL